MSNSVGIKDGYIPSSKEEDSEPTTKEYLKEILLNQQIILIRLSRIKYLVNDIRELILDPTKKEEKIKMLKVLKRKADSIEIIPYLDDHVGNDEGEKESDRFN